MDALSGCCGGGPYAKEAMRWMIGILEKEKLQTYARNSKKDLRVSGCWGSKEIFFL